MGRTIEIPESRSPDLDRLRAWNRRLLAITLMLVVAVLSLVTIEVLVRAGPGAWEVFSRTPVDPVPSAELPREWRWERKDLTYDDMYREGGAPAGLDWIRDPSRSRTPARNSR